MTQFSNNRAQKLYRFEVDQSGRIEELNRATVIATGNAEQAFCLLIPAKIKRKMFEQYRMAGKPKRFGLEVFAAAVTDVAVNSPFRIHELVIDIEYPGHERRITQIVSCQLPSVQIHFQSVGKNSPAHKKAYFTFKRQIESDTVLQAKDIPHFLAIKDGRRTVTPRVYTDSQPNRPVYNKHK